MKTPLSTEVDLGPGHIVLDGDPAPSRKGHSSPLSFRTMSIVATVAHLSYCAELLLYNTVPKADIKLCCERFCGEFDH